MTASPLLLALALFALGALLMALAHRRRHALPARRRADWVKYAVYLALIGALLAAASVGRWLVGAAVAALVVGGAVEAGRAFGGGGSLRVWAVRILAALLLAAAWGHMLLGPARLWPHRFAFLLLVTGSTDAFAQIWGMLLGTRKLCPASAPRRRARECWEASGPRSPWPSAPVSSTLPSKPRSARVSACAPQWPHAAATSSSRSSSAARASRTSPVLSPVTEGSSTASTA